MLKKIFIVIVLLLIISSAGYVLVKAYPDFKAPVLSNEKPIDVTLEFWGLWDNSDSWQGIINAFQNKNFTINGRKINIRINYTKKDYLTYEKDLLAAKGSGTSPDIFTISSNWLERYAPDLFPLEQNKAYIKEYELLTFENILDAFPQETIKSWVYSGQLYGIPTYSDSLALYYNIELFDKAGIKNPPKTWKEFKDDVKKLTSTKNDNIIRSGVAIGSGKNVNRSSDILALLMMQGGAKIIDQEGNVDINKEIEVITTGGPEKRNPGLRAIIFYSEFSDPLKDIYTWNNTKPDSFEAFKDQKVAMMFGYSYQISNLLAASPDLKYGISPMPQLEDSTPINISSVWTPVVSKKESCGSMPKELSDEIDCKKLAWSFLSFAAQKENSKKYLDSTGKPAARNDLTGEQVNSNSKVGVFASQAQTVMTYNKFDERIDGILSNMMDMIELDRGNLENIVNQAVEEIEALKTGSPNMN
ncbi:MAG: extracellular solute-binding protein [Candidatus Paceibacterota bacterium]|jgi:ABC-type glycerol-3-phosphate transport system substrate-binding protein